MYFLIAAACTVCFGVVGYLSFTCIGIPEFESKWFGSLLALLAAVVLYPDPEEFNREDY